MAFFRKKGISLLIPTQNSESTVEMCIRSFAAFPDEMIVVDNGSTDNTINIVRSLEKEYDHLTFYDVPHLKDLYENRQYAFKRSKYNWIVRIDSDYIAHTTGKYDIKKLRKLILNTKRGLRPISYGITQVNLFGDFYHTGREDLIGKSLINKHVMPPVSKLGARIIQHYPGMKFQRKNRWEGVRWSDKLKSIQLQDPYWFHFTLKTKLNQFFRSERSNWRELGDFKKYPTLDSYVDDVIRTKYNTSNIEQACEVFYKKEIYPHIIKYDKDKYYDYPQIILDNISRFKLNI